MSDPNQDAADQHCNRQSQMYDDFIDWWDKQPDGQAWDWDTAVSLWLDLQKASNEASS